MQTLTSLAGELSAPGLLEIDTQHRAYPFSMEELRQMQDAILDAAWNQAVEDLSRQIDPNPAPTENVRIVVEWDDSDAPFGVEAPTRYVLVPQHIYSEGLRDEEVVDEWLYDKYGWHVISWWT